MTTPKSIIDKNGKHTTVHVNEDKPTASARIQGVAPKSVASTGSSVIAPADRQILDDHLNIVRTTFLGRSNSENYELAAETVEHIITDLIDTAEEDGRYDFEKVGIERLNELRQDRPEPPQGIAERIAWEQEALLYADLYNRSWENQVDAGTHPLMTDGGFSADEANYVRSLMYYAGGQLASGHPSDKKLFDDAIDAYYSLKNGAHKKAGGFLPWAESLPDGDSNAKGFIFEEMADAEYDRRMGDGDY